MLAFDHAIVVVDDPAAWAADLRDRTGLVAVPGGEHQGLGTGNWIVPLGDSYLELMTVIDPTKAAASQLGQWVLARIGAGGGLTALCLRTDDLDGVASRIGDDPLPMSRRTADGDVVSWRLAGLGVALSDERLPFFIQWDVGGAGHPGATSAGHDVEPSGIHWVEYGGDAVRLDSWLGDHSLALRHVGASPGPRAVAVGAGPDVVRITTTGIASANP